MRTLERIEEFKREADGALFTKQQAIAVTLRLLEAELADPDNGPEDKTILEAAVRNINFNYLDSHATDTDAMLDNLGVARFTAVHIAEAIHNVLFDVSMR